MLVRKVAIENVRSFLDREELDLDGQISIVIGPNGGGKTNLLDTAVMVLRRYLFMSSYAVSVATPEQPDLHEFRHNDMLNNMILERHSAGVGQAQTVEVELEATARDVENMRSMKENASRLLEVAAKKYRNLPLQNATQWSPDAISLGQRFKYRVNNGNVEHDGASTTVDFLQYLQQFEMASSLRAEYSFAPLSTPMMYLHVNRSANGFQSTVALPNFNDAEQKRQIDAAFSRYSPSIVAHAVGRLAQKFRLLLERDKGIAAKEFLEDKNVQELTKLLKELGYEWTLESVNPLANQYDVRLKKQGSSFSVGAASSGERELLTYLFAIFALNVRDAFIVVDEPELHLHPNWQKTLLQLFVRLAETTGNQFLLATHSPTFVSPQSIRFVSRVFSREQKSKILRLNATELPEMKHLLSIVNSQNNERIFFADEVVLVEGLSDRIFFEAVLDLHGRTASSKSILEVVSVGGKGFFEAYKRILRACQIDYSIIADLDFVEEIGSAEIKPLFRVDFNEIKKDVIDNTASMDGTTLVARIEEGFKSGNWGDANAIWNYIKSRRRKLRIDLKADELDLLRSFLNARQAEKIYVLSRGSLEDYLPTGYKSKDLDKLIRFLSESDFWDKLPDDARGELTQIVHLIMRRLSKP
jgi:putative ATP-dependent endonuclease of the OLD family